MWLTVLSDQLPIVALVSLYLTNKLMGRGPIPKRPEPLLDHTYVRTRTSGISSGFPLLSPTSGYVAHVLLTRLPLGREDELFPKEQLGYPNLVRLAFIRHAASVRPEP